MNRTAHLHNCTFLVRLCAIDVKPAINHVEIAGFMHYILVASCFSKSEGYRMWSSGTSPRFRVQWPIDCSTIDERGGVFLWNVMNHLPSNTTPHLQRQNHWSYQYENLKIHKFICSSGTGFSWRIGEVVVCIYVIVIRMLVPV